MRLHPLFALAIPASCAAASTPAVPAGLVVPRAPIAGGKPAASGELSFMVAVEFRGEHVMCGGSLISPTAVLTLSTCVGNRGIANIQVRAGAHVRFVLFCSFFFGYVCVCWLGKGGGEERRRGSQMGFT